jgi:hypothetical protein
VRTLPLVIGRSRLLRRDSLRKAKLRRLSRFGAMIEPSLNAND